MTDLFISSDKKINKELNKVLKKAIKRMKEMNAEEREAMFKEQAISWSKQDKD